METTNLIQSTAKVVKITSLKKWDLIKYIDDSSSYSTDVKYWIVTDLMNTWEKSFIEVILYTKSYDNVKVEIKLFKWWQDINIFPATIDDIQEYFSNIEKSLIKKIEEKKDEVYNLEKWFNTFKEFVSWETSKKLSTPDFISITQEEYQENKRLKEEKRKQLLEEVKDTWDIF